MTDTGGASITLNPQQGSTAARRASDRQQRINNLLALFLVAVVALAPIPLGGNRPFFWGLAGAVLGLVGAAYVLVVLGLGEPLRFGLDRLRVPAALFLGLCGFLVVQVLPVFGRVDFVSAAGDVVESATLSLAPGSTWLRLLQLATYAIFFLLLLQVAVNRKRARLLGQALLYIVCAHALYGLVALTMLGDPLLFFEKWAYEGFATGTFVNRNSFATFLAFGLVLGATLALRELVSDEQPAGISDGLRRAAPSLICGVVILAALVASGSRMGLLAGLIGVGTVALMAIGKRPARRWSPAGVLIGVAAVLAAAGVLLLHGAGTFERLGTLEADWDVRGALYAQVAGMIAVRPWLGHGGGAFELAYPLFHQLPVSADLVWDRAHSTYLTLWAELGLVFGSILPLIVLIFALEAFGLYRRRSADWAAPAAAVAVVLVGALHSIVDFSLEIQANVLLFLAIIALGIARPETRPADPAT